MKKSIIFWIKTFVCILCFYNNQGFATEVGAGKTYTTLKSAFDAINSGVLTGNVVLEITSNTTETSSANLNYVIGCTSVTIYPTGAGGYTIRGSIANLPLVCLTGARYVTIDGRVGRSGSTVGLTFENTDNSSACSAICLKNSSMHNILRYCTIKGSHISTNCGVIFFSTSTAGNGNDSNTVEYCNITNSGGNRPVIGIYSEGTASRENSNNLISNNNLYDLFRVNSYTAAINISLNSTDWSILNNNIYQTTSTNFTSNSYYYGIIIGGSAGNYYVNNNYFGGSSPQCGGSPFTMTGSCSLIWLFISIGSTSTCNVQGNFFQNLSITASTMEPFRAIKVSQGKVRIGTITGNTIGNSTGTGNNYLSSSTAAKSYGITIAASADSAVISNNIIGSILAEISGNSTDHAFTAIYSQGTGVQFITNNSIGSQLTSNSIYASSTFSGVNTTRDVSGIICSGDGANAIISGNSISNLTHAYAGTSASCGTYGIGVSGTGNFSILNNSISNLSCANACTAADNTCSIAGIYNIATGTTSQTVSGNTIRGLTNTNSAASICISGIYLYCPASGSNSVNANFINSYSINTSSINAQLFGIRTGKGAITFSNNIVNLGTGIDKDISIYGIDESGTNGSAAYYFNTVYIGGTYTGTSNKNSYAFSLSNTANPKNIRNNIFLNARSRTAGSAQHYAFYISGKTNLTDDYNDFYTTGTGGIMARVSSTDYTTLTAAFRTASGGNTNSLNVNPVFVNSGGTAASDYLNRTILTATTGTGISYDYNGSCRTSTPNMGAFEFQYWNGSSSGDWNTAGNWTPSVVPSSNATINIPDVTNDPVLDQNRSITNIIIAAGAILTIPPAITLTVTGSLVNNAGNSGLVIQSTAAGTGNLIHSTQNVAGTVQRYLTGSVANKPAHMITSPVKNTSIASLWTKGKYMVNWYDETNIGAIDEGWTRIDTGKLVNTRGYSVVSNYASSTISFSGNLVVGTDISNQAAVSFTSSGSSADDGWNLIGNPYPCALNTTDFLSNNSSVLETGYNAVYFWDNPAGSLSRGDYATRNSVGGTTGGSMVTPDATISVCQAFFVKVKSGSSYIGFNPSLRISNSGSQFFIPDIHVTGKSILTVDGPDSTYNETLITFLPTQQLVLIRNMMPISLEETHI